MGHRIKVPFIQGQDSTDKPIKYDPPFYVNARGDPPLLLLACICLSAALWALKNKEAVLIDGHPCFNI